MTDTPFPGISRRSFMARGAALAAVPLAGRLHAAARPAVAREGAVRVGYVPASVGLQKLEALYLNGSDGPRDASRHASIRPASAAAAVASPATWIVGLHGLQVPARGSRIGSLDFDVLYRNESAASGALPFRAWSGSPANGEVPTPLSFNVPAGVLEGFAVSAGVAGAHGLRAALSRAVGRARSGDGGFSAAPGLYLVAAPDAGGRPVDWRRLRVELASRGDAIAGARLCDPAGRDAGHDCLFVTLTPA